MKLLSGLLVSRLSLSPASELTQSWQTVTPLLNSLALTLTKCPGVTEGLSQCDH